MFKILVSFFRGYVNIIIEGYFIEKFINICASKRIVLMNMDRKKASVLHANVAVSDFRRIKQVAKTTRCRVKINKKRGIPFIANKYKKRKIFFFSLLAILLCIFVSSMFVWNIEITGDTQIAREELISDLNRSGLVLGKWKFKVDTKSITDEIRLQRNDVAWIGIHIKGTNAIVSIADKVKKAESIGSEEYCDIVSDKTGVITSVLAQEGTASVKVGDVVEKGSTLISGWMEGKYTDTRHVHARGEIYAKVWYTEKESVYLNQSIQVKTGNEENKYSVSINNFKINLYKRLTKFENYDTIISENKLKLFSNFYLPITITKQTNYELKNEDKTYSVDEAKELGVEALHAKLDTQIANENDVVNKSLNVHENEGFIELELTYEVLEKIGEEQKIIF